MLGVRLDVAFLHGEAPGGLDPEILAPDLGEQVLDAERLVAVVPAPLAEKAGEPNVIGAVLLPQPQPGRRGIADAVPGDALGHEARPALERPHGEPEGLRLRDRGMPEEIVSSSRRREARFSTT